MDTQLNLNLIFLLLIQGNSLLIPSGHARLLGATANYCPCFDFLPVKFILQCQYQWYISLIEEKLSPLLTINLVKQWIHNTFVFVQQQSIKRSGLYTHVEEEREDIYFFCCFYTHVCMFSYSTCFNVFLILLFDLVQEDAPADQEDVVVHPNHHTRSVDPCSIDLQSLFVNIKSIFVAFIHPVMQPSNIKLLECFYFCNCVSPIKPSEGLYLCTMVSQNIVEYVRHRVD